MTRRRHSESNICFKCLWLQESSLRSNVQLLKCPCAQWRVTASFRCRHVISKRCCTLSSVRSVQRKSWLGTRASLRESKTSFRQRRETLVDACICLSTHNTHPDDHASGWSRNLLSSSAIVYECIMSHVWMSQWASTSRPVHTDPWLSHTHKMVSLFTATHTHKKGIWAHTWPGGA